MADENDDILKEFQEFLAAKSADDKKTAEDEDFDVEIWDKEGKGVRTKRSHARPFLQQLGLDLEPEPTKDETEKGEKTKSGKTTPVKTPPVSSVRKYFTPKT